MTSLLGLAGLATLVLLALFCGYRPRLGAALSVGLFGPLGVTMACQGYVVAPLYCFAYAFLLGSIARISFTTSKPTTTSPAKE